VLILWVVQACTYAAIMAATPPEPAAQVDVWRLVTTPRLHVGIRPAASLGEGAAVTIQVSEAVLPW
jgi:hypothetical protein